jgi:leader peptidase (prepilin peptidase) / N-methyltransferase
MNRLLNPALLIDAAPLALCFTYAALGVAGLAHGPASPPIIALSAVLGSALLLLSTIDLRTLRLPDRITLPLTFVGPLLAYGFGWGGLLWHVASAAAGYVVLVAFAYAYAALRGRDGLGRGDAKLFAAAGGWLGMECLPSVLLWATGIALAMVMFAALLRLPISGTSKIPFGPFLALGFWLVWLFGPLGLS